MKLLALDPGYRNLGVCLIDLDYPDSSWDYPDFRRWVYHGVEDSMLTWRLHAWLGVMIGGLGLGPDDLVVIEVNHRVSEAVDAVFRWCVEIASKYCAVHLVDPIEICRRYDRKGAPRDHRKAARLRRVRSMVSNPEAVETHDLADAFLLAKVGISTLPWQVMLDDPFDETLEGAEILAGMSELSEALPEVQRADRRAGAAGVPEMRENLRRSKRIAAMGRSVGSGWG